MIWFGKVGTYPQITFLTSFASNLIRIRKSCIWDTVRIFFLPRLREFKCCQSDLDNLNRRAGDAATKAEDVSGAEAKLRHCFKDDDERAGCKFEAHSYKNAKLDLESALDDVRLRTSSVSNSCEFNFAKALITPFDYKARSCSLHRRYKSAMPVHLLVGL